jgi:pyridinium-3,5-biscarboxylic acid mononucleotide sulfurtransferase
MSSLIQIRKPEGGNGNFAAKQAELFARMAELPSLLIAVSGGADSAYLAWAANQVLRERALSVTAISASFSA